jgi:hypothetical protein
MRSEGAMGYTDRQRAEWLASRDADDYFERLQEQRDGYGQDGQDGGDEDPDWQYAGEGDAGRGAVQTTGEHLRPAGGEEPPAAAGGSCGECNGTGQLERLGGDWGQTAETQVPCWACKGSGKQNR